MRYKDTELPDGPALDQALARMFKGEPDLGLIRPRSWRPWTPPDNQVAADQAITSLLLNRSKGDKKLVWIRSPDDLQNDGIACPYYYNRLAVAAAYCYATISTAQHNADITYKGKLYNILNKDLQTAMLATNKAISNINKCFEKKVLEPRSKYGADLSRKFIDEYNRDLYQKISRVSEIVPILQDISDTLKAEKSKFTRKKGTKPKVFAASFARQLSYIYKKLTNNLLADSESGVEYLDCCFRSFGGKSKGWSRSIDNAREEIESEHINDSGFLVDPGMLLMVEILSSRNINSDAAIFATQLLYSDELEFIDKLRAMNFSKYWNVSKLKAGGGTVYEDKVVQSLIDQIETSKLKYLQFQ